MTTPQATLAIGTDVLGVKPRIKELGHSVHTWLFFKGPLKTKYWKSDQAFCERRLNSNPFSIGLDLSSGKGSSQKY